MKKALKHLKAAEAALLRADKCLGPKVRHDFACACIHTSELYCETAIAALNAAISEKIIPEHRYLVTPGRFL